MNRPLRVVVADDNPVVRAGLGALLAAAGIEVVAQAADGRAACEAAAAHRPDAVLLDVRMPGMDGMTALPLLVRLAPVLMLTYSHLAPTVREAIRRGASGYLVHGEFTADRLIAAVRDTAAGGRPLSATAEAVLRGPAADAYLQLQQPSLQSQRDVAQSSPERSPAAGPGRREYFRLSRREEEVMELIASGMSNQQIAATCFISEKTVKNHINRIFGKLQAASRSEAIALWLGTARGGPRRPWAGSDR